MSQSERLAEAQRLTKLRADARKIVDELPCKSAKGALDRLTAFTGDNQVTYGADLWKEIIIYTKLKYARELISDARTKLAGNPEEDKPRDFPSTFRCFADAIVQYNDATPSTLLPVKDIENLLNKIDIDIAQKLGQCYPSA